MTDDLVGQLQERMAAATALPWEMNPPGAYWDRGMTYTVPAIGMDDKSYYPSAPEKEDAELIVDAVNALPTLLARIEALEGENRDLKESGVAFGAPWAVQYAKQCGLPDGHLHPTHFDILETAGARMDAFTRAALAKDKSDG